MEEEETPPKQEEKNIELTKMDIEGEKGEKSDQKIDEEKPVDKEKKDDKNKIEEEKKKPKMETKTKKETIHTPLKVTKLLGNTLTEKDF